MQANIERFVDAKRIAVVGVSRGGGGFGNMALMELEKSGYDVVAVNPAAEEVEGRHCYPTLAAIEGGVDAVLLTLPAEAAVPVLDQAAGLGIETVWLQQGSESPELLEHARELGLDVVSKRCALMYARPRHFHKLHRGLAKVFGGL